MSKPWREELSDMGRATAPGWLRVAVLRFREAKDGFQRSNIQDRIKLELRRKGDVLRSKLSGVFLQCLQIQEKLQSLSEWTEKEGGRERMMNEPGHSALTGQQVLTTKCPHT